MKNASVEADAIVTRSETPDEGSSIDDAAREDRLRRRAAAKLEKCPTCGRARDVTGA